MTTGTDDGGNVWRRAPAGTVVALHDTVHIWRAALDCEELHLASCHPNVAADRRPPREDGIVGGARLAARAVLRDILSRYLNIAARDIPIRRGPCGKPQLAFAGPRDSLKFNLSHTGRVALCAVATDREVGIDVERVRSVRVQSAVAGRFFTEAENRELRALPPSTRTEAFFACWTRKEAYIKARGLSLIPSLKQFSVSVSPQFGNVSVSSATDDVAAWSLQSIDVGPEYAAAVAVEGVVPRIEFWSWPCCPEPVEDMEQRRGTPVPFPTSRPW